MAVENNQPQEMDLDRTDKLPILEGVLFDDDVADDALHVPGAHLARRAFVVGLFLRRNSFAPHRLICRLFAESVRSRRTYCAPECRI